MKKGLLLAIGIVFILIGICIGFYPEFSNYVNTKNQSYAIETYETHVNEIPKEETEDKFLVAQKYNEKLYEIGDIRQAKIAYLNDELSDYFSILNVNNDNIIGVLSIPSIKVDLPIYHGTNDPELAVGVGHLEYTSFPAGTVNSHMAVCGHTALATAKLLTDLDQVELGDEFFIKVLDEEFKYIVDDIRIVEPEDYDCLNIVNGKSYVTIITCTPPGVGTQRLLVRGEQIIE